ncbi:hypothetical protein D047_4903A, partial [Vibrio parahaemolyticus VPTS-2010_2]
MFKYRYTKT